jgi:uncharacterized membrane protein
MPLKLAILLPIIVAAVVLLMNHALALKREKKYRAFWANASFAMAVALSSALYLATDPEVPVETRDVILGVLGAALGAAVAIWIGHIGGDWRANAQSPGGPPLMSDKAPLPQPPINAPNNSGIIAPYNSGSITQNQEPPHTPLGLYQSGQSIGRVQSFSVSPDGSWPLPQQREREYLPDVRYR